MFWSLNRSLTLPSSKFSGNPTFTLLGGSERTLGNMNRSVPNVMPAIAAAKAYHATANQENSPMNDRRDGSDLAAAGLAGIGGFGGGGAAGVAGAGGFAATSAAGGVAGAGGVAPPGGGVVPPGGLAGFGSAMRRSVGDGSAMPDR